MSRLDAGRVAACYAALWAAHDLADHVIQTDEQARAKTLPGGPIYWAGPMLGHLAGYGAAQATALAVLHGAGVRLSPRRAAVGLALSLVTHGVLDRRWPVVRLLERTGSARFAAPAICGVDVHGAVRPDLGPAGAVFPAVLARTDEAPLPLHGPYLADQALHHACVWLAALIAAGGRP